MTAPRRCKSSLIRTSSSSRGLLSIARCVVCREESSSETSTEVQQSHVRISRAQGLLPCCPATFFCHGHQPSPPAAVDTTPGRTDLAIAPCRCLAA